MPSLISEGERHFFTTVRAPVATIPLRRACDLTRGTADPTWPRTGSGRYAASGRGSRLSSDAFARNPQRTPQASKHLQASQFSRRARARESVPSTLGRPFNTSRAHYGTRNYYFPRVSPMENRRGEGSLTPLGATR